MESFNYPRVHPRDFFNESKLLKCLGFLHLAVMDKGVPESIEIEIREGEEPHDIIMDLETDLLLVSNYGIKINGEEYLIGSKYNAKDSFPLYVKKEEEDLIRVLDEEGKLSQAFIEAFTKG